MTIQLNSTPKNTFTRLKKGEAGRMSRYSREERSEVDNLATALHTLDQAQTDDGPGRGQTTNLQ